MFLAANRMCDCAKVLLVSQVALTVVLLASAGFFVRSLMNLKGQDLGVHTDHVIQFSVSPELNRYTPVQTVALVDRLRETSPLCPACGP